MDSKRNVLPKCPVKQPGLEMSPHLRPAGNKRDVINRDLITAASAKTEDTSGVIQQPVLHAQALTPAATSRAEHGSKPWREMSCPHVAALERKPEIRSRNKWELKKRGGGGALDSCRKQKVAPGSYACGGRGRPHAELPGRKTRLPAYFCQEGDGSCTAPTLILTASSRLGVPIRGS